MAEQDLRQVNYRVNPTIHRMGRQLAELRGESLAAMSRGLLEDYVTVELGIDPTLEGVSLDVALVDAEIGMVQDELANLEAEKTELQTRL